MPATTRRQSRSLAQPVAMNEGERNCSENMLSATPQASDDDDDDPMDGPLGELSSSEVDDDNGDDDGEDDSEDEHVSSLSEDEESDASEFGEGTVFCTHVAERAPY